MSNLKIERALNLRKQGLTYREIGDKMGLSDSGAFYLININKERQRGREGGRRWRQKIRENPEKYKALLEKTNQSTKKWYQAIKKKPEEYKSYLERKNKLRNRYRAEHPDYFLKWKEQDKKRLVDFLGGKCNHCGNSDERVFEIHHKNGDFKVKNRKGEWQRRRGWRWRKKEWKELQLLCANCHRISHWDELKRKRTKIFGIKGLRAQ